MLRGRVAKLSSDDLVFPIQKMEENLKHCIFVFGNRILADSDVLGKPFED